GCGGGGWGLWAGGAGAVWGGLPGGGGGVAADAEAAQARFGHRGDVRMVAKTLARKDVADMDLDHRPRDRRDRVADGDRGVGIRARVDDDAGGLFGGGLVDQVHDLALVVRLAEFDGELMAPRGFAAKLLHVPERRAAIGLWLAGAEQIEVG